jgi:hypothetical protein
MDEPLDLNKKRVIPEVTYSVVENLGWDARDKKQRTVGTITQLQYLDLQDEIEDRLAGIKQDKIKLIDEKSGELLLECKVSDKTIQYLLEVGLNTILEKFINENDWESKIDKEWTPIDDDTKRFDVV